MRFIEELKKLDFPQDKFAVFGSGCMAIRNLRENKDIDILVREDLWQELVKNHSLNEKGQIEIGNIEVCRKIIHLENVDKLIDDADIIGGLKFVRLDYLLEWKRKMGREKDIKDIKLIEEYLKNKRPDIGVAVIVLNEKKVLMCERYAPDKKSTWWSFPGGRMEFGESFEDTAIREIKEETDLDIKIINKNPVAVTNEIISKDKHHITLFLEAIPISGELKIIEPDKFMKFEWFEWNNLPQPLSPQAQNLIKQRFSPLT